jgi:hypothetical protein
MNQLQKSNKRNWDSRPALKGKENQALKTKAEQRSAKIKARNSRA